MRNLLVIDDEPAIARLIQKVAASCGYAVTVTHGGEQFTGEIMAREPDAIVMDLSLPDIDGIELLRFLGTAKCKAKILIISGFDARVLETAGRLGGELGLRICGTLTKPIRVAELRDKIAALHEAGA